MIEYLGAHHNVDQEFRKNWGFIDKLNFLRRKYVRHREWTKENQTEAIRSLGYRNTKSINPLLQLVAGPTEKWQALEKIVASSKEKVGSDVKFRCLQGSLTEGQVIKLLQAVAAEEISLDDMNRKANELKLDAAIKVCTAQLLGMATFAEVEEKYGDLVFNAERRKSFFAAFKDYKPKKDKGTKTVLVPPTFARYVEDIRVRKTNQQQLIESGKLFTVAETVHKVFQIDVQNLVQLVSKDRKFECCKYLSLDSRIF